ncbi:hypothetical protein EJ07DRAFT_157165 [Lizonia empirigonia]|nr:hypothetical protein EJ07DRAFT_157165 [Lizonia empirigonia]
MSDEASPTTPKAQPAKVAAVASASSPTQDNFERMEKFKARYPPQSLGDRFLSARNLEHTRAPSPPPPRSYLEDAARAPPVSNSSTAVLGPPVDTGNTHTMSHVAPDGSLVRSSAGFRSAVPGSYRSPFDYNVQRRAAGSGTGSFAPQYSLSASYAALGFPSAPNQAPVASTRTPPSVSQTQAVIPAPETPQRLVLLGPLKMIRSQCAKKAIFRPVLIWLDQFMGEELRTPVQTDALISTIVYAVNIPMDDEHWRDWNKVLAVFPRAAAWQKALTPEEPFDQVTGEHPTITLFREGEELESLLADLVETYNLGIQYDVDRPWDMPGQTDWKAAEAREAYALR